MRRSARVDANQKEIVADLREIGATVLHLHGVGKGCPDILVGYRGVNVLMEIKDGKKMPSQRKTTHPQDGFFATWRGAAIIVRSSDEAIEALTAATNWPARNQVQLEGVIA